MNVGGIGLTASWASNGRDHAEAVRDRAVEQRAVIRHGDRAQIECGCRGPREGAIPVPLIGQGAEPVAATLNVAVWLRSQTGSAAAA